MCPCRSKTSTRIVRVLKDPSLAGMQGENSSQQPYIYIYIPCTIMFVYFFFLLLPTIPSCTYATFRLRQFKCDPITISNPDWAGYHQRLLGSNLLSARGRPCQRPGCHNLQSPEPESHGPQAQCCSSTLPRLLILPHRLHTSSRIVPVREIITVERMTSTGFVHRNAKPALGNGDRATHITGIENSQRRPSGAFLNLGSCWPRRHLL